ncbi:MAG: glycosyltransferase [Bacteroidota bacterium]
MIIYAGFIFRNAWFFSRIQVESPLFMKETPMVSVIIPARNEASSLQACLNSAAQQIYPKDRYEVIVVDDHSTDATFGIAAILGTKYPNIRIVSSRGEGKKAALNSGISVARGEIILQTDADCDLPPTWIPHMVAQFNQNTALVSGPVELQWGDKWLEKFQAMESMGLVTIGGGSMAARKPNMCNGANLAFRKAVFQEVNGYEGIDAVASGDDELLLQKIHRLGKYELKFARCKEAIVRTIPQPNWQMLKSQRLRWVSKARVYPDRRVNLIQSVSYLAFLSIPLLTVFACWNWQFAVLAGELLILKILTDYLLMYQAAKFFHNLRMLRYVLPLQLVYIPYVLWVGLAGNLVKTYSWKGRTVR